MFTNFLTANFKEIFEPRAAKRFRIVSTEDTALARVTGAVYTV
jgi:hypothetical protein